MSQLIDQNITIHKLDYWNIRKEQQPHQMKKQGKLSPWRIFRRSRVRMDRMDKKEMTNKMKTIKLNHKWTKMFWRAYQ
jgi:hypothetical protein